MQQQQQWHDDGKDNKWKRIDVVVMTIIHNNIDDNVDNDDDHNAE